MNTQQSVVIAEVLRGAHVESRHTGAFAVADARGHLVRAGGDPERAIYPRSAVKALQALPLVASGAANALGLTDRQLALACASHVGMLEHVETAASMLARAARTEACLECGTHWPSSATAARALAASGHQPGPLHNNCSGKHAGFVCLAVASGRDVAGYVAAGHPVMREVTSALSAVTGAALDREAPAIDGCSIPSHRITLHALAAGFARFGTGTGLPLGFSDAARTLRRAVAAHPTMVAGAERFDTVLAAALGETAFVKVGAEGVYCGALPALGLGFALKCDDGATRAAEAATAALLLELLGPHPMLSRLANPVLTNWRGTEVGHVHGYLGA